MKLPTTTNLSTSRLRTETRAAIALLTDALRELGDHMIGHGALEIARESAEMALLRIRNAITEEQRATAAGEVRR